MVGENWLDENKLADLDCANDIVVFDETWSGMQQLTNIIEDYASKVWLCLHKLWEISVFEVEEINTIHVGGGYI